MPAAAPKQKSSTSNYSLRLEAKRLVLFKGPRVEPKEFLQSLFPEGTDFTYQVQWWTNAKDSRYFDMFVQLTNAAGDSKGAMAVHTLEGYDYKSVLDAYMSLV